jgi:hypothetical protein
MSDQHDPVSHPTHYTRGGIEVLAAIEAWGLGFHLGNVVKYVARAGHKAGSPKVQDLQKAEFLLRRYIDKMEVKHDG